MNFALSRSQAYKDSVKQFSLQKKRLRQRVQKVVFGVLTGALSGAGLYFDLSASSAINRADNAAVEYDAGYNNFSVQRATYYKNRDDAKKVINSRNILFEAAGVCLLGFGLSFVF